MNLDWEVIGGIVGLLGLIAKGIHWIWTRFRECQKEIDDLKERLGECENASAKKDIALELTSRYIKDKFIDGLDNFIDNETK